jgi:hypothetical protein
VTTLDEELPTLVTCDLPRVLPSLMAHTVAQGEHRIHVGTFPSHATAFEPGLTHERVGTFHHPGTDRPSGLSKEGRLHQREPCAQLAEMLANLFSIGFVLR